MNKEERVYLEVLAETYSLRHLELIAKSMKNNVFNFILTNKEVSIDKLEIIYDGLVDGVFWGEIEKDLEQYSLSQLREIGKALRESPELRYVFKPSFSTNKIHELKVIYRNLGNLDFLEGIDLETTRTDRLALFYEGHRLGKDNSLVLNEELVPNEIIQEVSDALINGADIDKYLLGDYTVWQKKELLLTINEGFDPTVLEDNRLSSSQMRQLRLGVVNRVDMSTVADYKLSSEVMKEHRLNELSSVTPLTVQEKLDLIDSKVFKTVK